MGGAMTSSFTFTCEICVEAALSTTLKFRHKYGSVHSFCVMCIARHIKEKVDENISTIMCPGFECDEILDPIECQPLISPHLFIRWLDSLCVSAVSDRKKCYCPSRHCSELIVNECDEAVDKCECPRCKTLLCFKCRVMWHWGYGCSERHQIMDSETQELGTLLEQMKWNRCPNCGQPVERIGGCNIILCRCGKSFCYKCGGEPHVFRRCSRGGRRLDFETFCMYFLLILLLLLTFFLFYFVVDPNFDISIVY